MVSDHRILMSPMQKFETDTQTLSDFCSKRDKAVASMYSSCCLERSDVFGKLEFMLISYLSTIV
jgi:hypothetical protein